jgi:membrane-bound lytic murein transglycosylase D
MEKPVSMNIADHYTPDLSSVTASASTFSPTNSPSFVNLHGTRRSAAILRCSVLACAIFSQAVLAQMPVVESKPILLAQGNAESAAPQPPPVAPPAPSPKPAPATQPAVQPAPPTQPAAAQSPAPSAAPVATPRNTAPSSAQPVTATADEAPIVATRPTNDADLWARIRRGYRMPDLHSELVTSQEQWYATRASYIGRMTERSNKYLYHIVEELERRNMPTELALLPFIESAFNPQAVSGAKAAGMWQFMPATGRDFALKQNIFRDDRRDVLASTRAALDYMQKLYRMFGDWHLALAAYNWGEGSVQRAIAKNQRDGLPMGYLDLSMPNETRNYVPKLQAVKNIVLTPTLFNATLPEIPNHPYFQSIPLARDLDVALAAKLAEIKLDDFKQLNPSANKPVLFASLTKQILLPWDNAGIFERNLAIHNGQTAGWTVWTAPTTLKAADAARRVGMSEAQFREINRIPPRMLIKAGSTLLVPRGATQQKDVSEQVADNGQISFAPEIVLVKQSVKLRKATSVAALASKYNVSAANLAGWNKVSAGSSFKAKQTVVLYLPKRAVAARGAKTGRAAKGAASARTSSKATKERAGASKPVARSKTAAVVKKPRKK